MIKEGIPNVVIFGQIAAPVLGIPGISSYSRLVVN